MAVLTNDPAELGSIAGGILKHAVRQTPLPGMSLLLVVTLSV